MAPTAKTAEVFLCQTKPLTAIDLGFKNHTIFLICDRSRYPSGFLQMFASFIDVPIRGQSAGQRFVGEAKIPIFDDIGMGRGQFQTTAGVGEGQSFLAHPQGGSRNQVFASCPICRGSDL